MHQCKWMNFIFTNVINAAIAAAKQQKRSGRIERQNRTEILNLPMLGHCVPDANFPRRRQRHQLIANEEQILNTNVQIENAHIAFGTIVGHTPQSNLTAIRDGNHFAQRLFARIGEINLNGEAFDGSLDVVRCEYELPARRIFQTITRDEMRICGWDPIMMGLDNLHTQRIRPAIIVLLRIEHQPHVVAYEFIEIGWGIAWVSHV